jgi:hypothetical protein
VGVANTSCPSDFLISPEPARAYKVWVTPVGSFLGDSSLVDNPCSGGCFHGFVASRSKTDNFTLGPSFCLNLQKQFQQPDGSIPPGPGWEFDITDTLGVVNPRYMDANGEARTCGLTPGAYTVAEDQYSAVVGLVVNGVSQNPSTIYSFTWKDKQPDPVILFINSLAVPQ